MKNILIFVVIFCLSIYAIPGENKTGGAIIEDTLIREDSRDYRNYFVSIAILVVIMVIASSIRQIQKYNQK